MRAVVIGQNRKDVAEHDGALVETVRAIAVAIVVTVLVHVGIPDAGDFHGFGAARQLPQELVATAQGIGGAGSSFSLQCVGELHAVDDLVFQAGAFRYMKFIAIAVAGAEPLIALAGLMERVEVHDEVEFVVRTRCYPRVGICVVGARLV